MKYAMIVLLLSGMMQGQTRAQLKEQIKIDNMLLMDQMAVIDSLVEQKSELERLLAEKQAESNRKSEVIKLMVESYTVVQNQNELLKIANTSLAGRPRTTFVLPPEVYVQAPEPTPVQIHIDAPYQPPVWEDSVHCSGYEMPVGGGITLTNQNCH